MSKEENEKFINSFFELLKKDYYINKEFKNDEELLESLINTEG